MEGGLSCDPTQKEFWVGKKKRHRGAREAAWRIQDSALWAIKVSILI